MIPFLPLFENERVWGFPYSEIDNFEGFKIVLNRLKLKYYVKKDNSCKDKNSNIDGKHFVITGFRDTDIIEYISNNGGNLQNEVNMKTDYLIIKDSYSQSSKLKKAKIMGVDIILKDDFNKFEFMSALVKIKDNIVARFGAIIPEPFAIPHILTSSFPTINSS